MGHPGRLTHEVVSVAREGDFVCVFCGSDLPAEWNVDS